MRLLSRPDEETEPTVLDDVDDADSPLSDDDVDYVIEQIRAFYA